MKTATRGEAMTRWEAWVKVSRARGLDEFDATLAGIGHHFSALYADARGSIAYWPVGRVPAGAEGDDSAVPLLHDDLDGESVESALTGTFRATVGAFLAVDPSPGSWRQPVALIQWELIGAGAVPDIIWMNRGTDDQRVHLGRGRELHARNVVAPGQSGDPFRPHFADQLGLCANGDCTPMGLSRRDLTGSLERRTRLTPSR